MTVNTGSNGRAYFGVKCGSELETCCKCRLHVFYTIINEAICRLRVKRNTLQFAFDLVVKWITLMLQVPFH